MIISHFIGHFMSNIIISFHRFRNHWAGSTFTGINNIYNTNHPTKGLEAITRLQRWDIVQGSAHEDRGTRPRKRQWCIKTGSASFCRKMQLSTARNLNLGS
eukprot:Blabericola_migrator_1__6801@NODE_3442_length_1774_cov_5_793790_g2140_i0_p1_GENE_NODE_3442_length_1774_cov_5_793790_g2140_i0NODE_3442_length_1774_cov_5_793790_g2140_i0_p1_ORF_typecomplete_len101_score11_54Ribosomal_S24e/PF01282_19/0_04_NODE_3442_length_1774_cov_5_793790_g2140_i010441346